jgi:hypothetical protein
VDAQKRDYLHSCAAALKSSALTAASGVGIATYDLSDATRARYAEMRQVLLKESALIPVLPAFLKECHTLDDLWSLAHTRFAYGVANEAPRRDWVRQQFLPVLDALENDRLPVITSVEGQKFFAPGTQHDGFVAIRELVSTAKKMIFIADNFVDKTLWPLLANFPPGSKISILTKKHPPDFRTEANAFAKQYGIEVEVRTTENIHDRFIVCDGQCWHLGASIKDFGMRAALISEVASQEISAAVCIQLEKIWQSAKPL